MYARGCQYREHVLLLYITLNVIIAIFFSKNTGLACCYCQLTIARNTMGDTHNHPEHRKFLIQ